jgi:peptide methionine sulfoxide reductase MsrA
MFATSSPLAIAHARTKGLETRRGGARVASRGSRRVAVSQASSEEVTTSSTSRAAPAAPTRRQALALALGAIAFGTTEATAPQPARAAAAAATGARPVYFGNGCFWGRQHTFYEAERTIGRTDDTITSVVGYAGGAGGAGSKDTVCYYYGAAETVYERLGHCEVVAVDVADEKEMKVMADAYFGSFQRIPGLGMQRVDPQDAGSGYRNCIGLPGGMDSPLFKVIQDANVNGMKLISGTGNIVKSGAKPTETDIINTVWVYDSAQLPFYPAEVYHQFHDGLGYKFPTEYTQGTKRNALDRGLISTTGCPEMRERSFADFVSTVA